MKKIILIIALSLIGTVFYGEVFFAEIEGMKVTVVNINLKKPSGVIGASAPGIEIDLTASLSAEAIGSINIEEADVTANELTFDFSNVEIPLKAYATTNGTDYYFTTPNGVGGPDTLSNKANWTDYGYMNVPKIESAPYNTSDRVVIQSYFPEPEFIGADTALVITGSIDLDYTVLFWDGVNRAEPQTSPFSYYESLYPDPGMLFAVSPPDIVLAMNTNLTKETYAFSSISANLDDTGTYAMLCRVVSFYFDADGNLYDGAVKKQTGYSATPLNNVQRVQASTRNGDQSYNLNFARNYSVEQGEYIFDTAATGTFSRLSSVGDVSGSTITIGGTAFYYKRLK